jgi:adenine-specific DNA-methyltransferase
MNSKELNGRINAIASLMGISNVETVSDLHRPKGLDEEVDCVLFRGDNLDTLSCLLKDGVETIDFCYIDPPYNTGQDFIYKDKRSKLSDGLWGKHHDWLAFMLPRIVSAHALLKSSGVIAISIDDYEYSHLKILMDCVFGPESYIASLIVCRSKNGKGSKRNVAVNHEYVLLYGKTVDASFSGLAESEDKIYNKEDEFGQFTLDGLFRKKGDASLKEDRPSMYYPLYYSVDGTVFTEKLHKDLSEVYPHDSAGVARRWLWGIDKANVDSWKLYASKNGVIYVKNYKSKDKKIKLRSILDDPRYLTDRATTEIKLLFGEKVFETPKPLALIRDLVDCCSPDDAIILDFFAGTGTTAEAVWDLNKRDGARRKTLLVEQNYLIDEKHVARKSGFMFTADITEFRLKSMQARDHNYKFSVMQNKCK